jgi:hypothetical protein
MNLLNHLNAEDINRLLNLIDNPGVYTMPSFEEVVDYLGNQEDDMPSEEVMYDLIIQYLPEEGVMFDFC